MDNTNSAIMRAKLRVNQVTQFKNAEGEVNQELIDLMAVYSPDENDVNHEWSIWTPSASLKITITNPNVFGKLSSGHEFYIDFIPCGDE